MSDSRRGKKQNGNKSYAARNEWMAGKKIGRKKQQWVWDNEAKWGTVDNVQPVGHWEKI
jgi:hypothetical protein